MGTNATPGTPYVPGVVYDATRGITKSQFEAPSGMAKAVPAEDGFLREPSALHRAIGVTNLSGQDLTVVCDRDKRINKEKPAVRENEKEINGFFLPNGSSGHFSIPPFCHHVSVSEFVESEDGGVKKLTRQGFELASLQNKVITYNPGEGQGLTTDAISTANIDHFGWVNNYTDHTLEVKITKSITAYAPSQDEIKAAKKSRVPDNGAEPVETKHIKPGGQWHFKTPPRIYTIRALQPPSEDDGVDSIMADNTRVPPDTDYVQLAEENARAAQWVIFFADSARNGYIVAKTYNDGELKLVNSDIVVNARNESA